MNKKVYSIAIDGPSGSGKTTMAKTLAETLGFVCVDTGAMYRTVALAILRSGITLEEITESYLMNLDIGIKTNGTEQRMFLSGEDVTNLIRTEEVSMMTSCSSSLPMVRSFLLSMQRDFSKRESVIMEGRDIGTVVIPNATLKVFLTTTPEVRAH